MCWVGKVEHKYVAKENIEVRKMLLKEREELFDENDNDLKKLVPLNKEKFNYLISSIRTSMIKLI